MKKKKEMANDQINNSVAMKIKSILQKCWFDWLLEIPLAYSLKLFQQRQ